MKRLCCLVAGLALWTGSAGATSITIGGLITQSTPDGTGPAANNPSLNNITDGQSYTLSLLFPGVITGPGTYDLTGSALTFNDASAPSTESDFAAIHLTISSSGGVDQFSLFACLTSGSGCNFGNQLDASFSIPAALLNSSNVVATGLDQPHPLDLLEDDGATDIQGSITRYSYAGSTVSPAPEPATLALMSLCLGGLALARRFSSKPQ